MTAETRERLGAIPIQFLKYWIDRFPRLLSHSYHALQSCGGEPIFSAYYPYNYAFTKPNYFYEVTEDFKPFEGGAGQKSRDSPKRHNQEYRYKPMNYPNFEMNRKPGQKPPNNGLMNMFDGNLGIYNRMNKKGSYNFHRPFNTNNSNVIHNNTFKVDQNEAYRNVDNFKAQENVELTRDGPSLEVVGRNENPQLNRPDTMEIAKFKEIIEKMVVSKDMEDNAIDFEMKKEMEKRNLEKIEKIESQPQTKSDETRKYNDKHTGNKKKMKAEAVAAASKEPTERDEDGFTKVRYRGNQNLKKQKNVDPKNENVNWIIPGRENKEPN